MTFRTRVAVLVAAAVAAAIVLVAGGVYGTTRATLYGTVDEGLREASHAIRVGDLRGALPRLPGRGGGRSPLGPGAGPLGDAPGFAQLIGADGRVIASVGTASSTLVPSDTAVAVARGDAPQSLETVDVDGSRVRVYTRPIDVPQPVALQVARPLDDVDASLSAMARQLLLAGLVGTLVAAALGALVARRAVRPVRRLTDAAEDVAATQDLTHRIDVRGEDEIARLASSFNAMLASLDQARQAQHQLVADASHELRTPLTSLRTNIEVLRMGGELEAEDRKRLLDDVVVQLDEFGRLVGALVELARGDEPVRMPTEVRLDDLVADVVARTRALAPEAQIEVHTAPTTVLGVADRIERAVANLLDNAVKYGAGRPIEVSVADGEVVVRDHGEGIPEADLPHVFDRFYRAPEARGMPGSGLGLSIVAQVAEAHGGDVFVSNVPDGGARFRLRLPVTDAAPD